VTHVLIIVVLAVVLLALWVTWRVMRWLVRGLWGMFTRMTGVRDKQDWAEARQRAAHAPPNRRRWSLALGDILSLRNGLPCDTDDLAVALPDDQRRRLAIQVLREMDLPANLSDNQVGAQVEQALAGWVSGFGRTLEGFYGQLASAGQVRDALAFECARTAFLVRCVSALGWVPEPKAWLVLFLNAQRAQHSFRSWEDFGQAYARARHAWLQASDRDGPASLRATAEVQSHLRDPASNWTTLPWDRYAIFDPQPVPPSASPVPPTR
jgi:hypothetical protein